MLKQPKSKLNFSSVRWLVVGFIALSGLLLARQLTAVSYANELAQQFSATQTPNFTPASRLIFSTTQTDEVGQAFTRFAAINRPLDGSTDGQLQSANFEVGDNGLSTPCLTSSLSAAPHGPWVVHQSQCSGETNNLQLVHSVTGQLKPLTPGLGNQNIFLGWSPNGQYALVLRDVLGDTRATAINVESSEQTDLALPSNVYNLALSHDGRKLIYSITRGLGVGSETWLADVDGGNARLIIHAPQHIVAYARFSPDDQKITYIRFADTNIPFTVSELWVMKADGTLQTLLSSADGGHGYVPAWSPDSTQIAYVVRENEPNVLANQQAEQLVSNIQIINLTTNSTAKITNFDNQLVEAPVWAPDGNQIAFAVMPTGGGISDIWVASINALGNELTQVTQNANARYPVFTSDR